MNEAFDLSEFSNRTILIRFWFGTDEDVGVFPGWYIDDIRLIDERAGTGSATVSPAALPAGSTNRGTFTYKAVVDMGSILTHMQRS